MQSYKYCAWVNTATKLAFLNPIHNHTAVGDVVNGTIAVAIGELDKIQAVVNSINAALPALAFGDLLKD